MALHTLLDLELSVPDPDAEYVNVLAPVAVTATLDWLYALIEQLIMLAVPPICVHSSGTGALVVTVTVELPDRVALVTPVCHRAELLA